ncbi:hypothetical protein J2S68_000361 [Glycomyces algeriensis]|uniref:Uncharacterized protein n=1 Tax=Glycomyces algeriensis TaxID=256037 RepID=A0A9W6LGC9_9ACTN|nr:hypothetical protein [Glycomyces algeriensis]MDR7348818.1 hypothetical protein [Glycomyces algeriensis]GLI41521.1 hypothetical protein GALLR39Z86_13710 [Glycomyces algeriensis]
MASKKNSTSSSASNPTSYRKNLIRSQSDERKEARQTRAIGEALAKFGEGHKDSDN